MVAVCLWAASTWALGFGIYIPGYPSPDVPLNPGQDSLGQRWYGLNDAKTQPGERCIGFEAELDPTDYFCSFSPDTVEKYLQVITGPAAEGAWWYTLTVYVGKVPASTPPGEQRPRLVVTRIGEPQEEGGDIIFNVGVIVEVKSVVESPTPLPTIFTLVNDTAYPICDGYIVIDSDTSRGNTLQEYFLHGLTIPAYGSLILNDVLNVGMNWSFGGLWTDGDGVVHPVMAFDTRGPSPLGAPYSDVLGGDYPVTGQGAAEAALYLPQPIPDPFLSYMQIQPGITPFQIYAFSDGELIGHGTAYMLPEPTGLLGLGLVALVARRRRRARTHR
ncbi:MAG TPA: PEP-CTERM sorting domain-containing protein [Planctomycetota bacterium]|nr:PEP-CTERM sorting domain-containing protein [Planctomycetota bacterium]